MTIRYFHIAYLPETGWVLTIMTRLHKSKNPQLRKAFDDWSDTPLRELGLATTTRMHMLGRCIRRLNARVAELRKDITEDISSQLDAALSEGYAFQLKDKELAYELLLDMDSFIFETRSLYEIIGKFLINLFAVLFGRQITQAELKSVLSGRGIDTRWIAALQESRKLFFHETAPWLAVSVQTDPGDKRFNPVLLKKLGTGFGNPDDFVDFGTLQAIYDGFVASITELHLFVMEQIRSYEFQAPTP